MGDATALAENELAGYQLFKEVGCVACHNGPAAGGTSFQKMGVVQPYVTTNPAEGRIGVTHEAIDRFRFKVPSLRNVELTYPYGDQPRFELPLLPPSTPETPRPVPFG